MTTTNTQILDTVTEKIQKILRLAEKGTEHEANIAMEKAKKLAAQHEINLALVNAWEIKEKEEYVNNLLINDGKSRLPITYNYIAWILQSHFKVRLVMFGGRCNGRRVHVIGLSQDVEIATYIYEYLARVFMDLWYDYKKKNNASTRDRTSYFYGLYSGLNSKLTKTQRETTEEIFNDIEEQKGAQACSEAKDKYALAVVDQKKKLTDALDNFYPKLRRSGTKTTSINNTNALQSGREAGRNINLNRGVSQSKSRQIGY